MSFEKRTIFAFIPLVILLLPVAGTMVFWLQRQHIGLDHHGAELAPKGQAYSYRDKDINDGLYPLFQNQNHVNDIWDLTQIHQHLIDVDIAPCISTDLSL